MQMMRVPPFEINSSLDCHSVNCRKQRAAIRQRWILEIETMHFVENLSVVENDVGDEAADNRRQHKLVMAWTSDIPSADGEMIGSPVRDNKALVPAPRQRAFARATIDSHRDIALG
jgi:hypothetical protein